MTQLTRKDLALVRDSAAAFLTVFYWNRRSGQEVQTEAAVRAMQRLRAEINAVARRLGGANG